MDILKFVDNYVKTNNYPITEYALVKMIEQYKQAENEQCAINDVVGRSELLNDVHKPCTKEEIGLGRCKEHCGKCEYIV